MIIKRQKEYSEEGKKKIAERKRKKANKRKWFLDQAKESDSSPWGKESFDNKKDLRAAEGKNWLGKHTNDEVVELLDKGSKPNQVTSEKDFLGLETKRTRRYNNLGGTSTKDIEAAEDALRAGRKVIDLENRGFYLSARKTPKEVSELDKAISKGKAGILDEHEMDFGHQMRLKEKVKERAERLKKEEAKRMRKLKIKKAAPYAIAGTLATVGTIAGIKVAKKKKSKESNKKQKEFGIIGDYLNARGQINEYKELADGIREANSGTIGRNSGFYNGQLSLSYGKKGKYGFKQQYNGLNHEASKKMDERIIKMAKKHNNNVLIRRSAPWVIGATATGVHAYKKKKSKKEDKKK